MCVCVCVCVCVCDSFSVIIICNSVYSSTFNNYVQLHFWEGVGGKGLFVLYWYKCPLVDFSLRELTHFFVFICYLLCTVCIWRCELARFCVRDFYAL